MSGRPPTKPSLRPVRTTPVPLSSIARRAARTRSTARSNRTEAQPRRRRVLDREPRDPGRYGEPHVRADLLRVVRRSRPRSRRSPARRPRRRGHEGASALVERGPLSARPRVQARPALVVASAWKPSCSRLSATPASQGFGMTKHPLACSRWNASTRSSCTVIGTPLREGRPGRPSRQSRRSHPAGAVDEGACLSAVRSDVRPTTSRPRRRRRAALRSSVPWRAWSTSSQDDAEHSPAAARRARARNDRRRIDGSRPAPKGQPPPKRLRAAAAQSGNS